MRLAVAQDNFLVGDIEGNAEKILSLAQQAKQRDAQLVLFPELALTGYPPEDLLLRPSLNSRIEEALTTLSANLALPVVLGYPAIRNGHRYNVAAFLEPGSSPKPLEYFKQHLPNYRVFDEKRYFQSGTEAGIFEFNGIRCAMTICEDIWHGQAVAQAKEAGAEIVLTLNASPYRGDKPQERVEVARQRVSESGLPMIYANLVGGQDELVFDGASFAINVNGELAAAAAFAESDLLLIDCAKQADGIQLSAETAPSAWPEQEAAMYQSLVLAVRDYVNKNGFKGALLGLSGGIDSALTLAIAVDALGADRVKAIMMPFRYTSQMSLEDAEAEARVLGVEYKVLPIEPIFNGFMSVLEESFAGMGKDTTEENLQARSRGTLLMALSNKLGYVVLTTGNKSEMAVGYATLYGDMAGGFSVIKDVSKTWVYRLSRYRNQLAGEEVIPDRVITRPPSAELAPDQVDQDSLPDYDVLDAVLELYVEQDYSAEAVIRAGYDRELVYKVVKMVDRNEYKRCQAAVGPRVTRRAFGKDRRYPITNGWRPGD